MGVECGILGRSISIWEAAFNVGLDIVTKLIMGSSPATSPHPANCWICEAMKYSLGCGTANPPLSLPYWRVVKLILAFFFFHIRSHIKESIRLNHLFEIHIGELWNTYESCGAHTVFIRFTRPTTDKGSLHQLLHLAICLSSSGPKFNPRSARYGDTTTPRYLKLCATSI